MSIEKIDALLKKMTEAEPGTWGDRSSSTSVLEHAASKISDSARKVMLAVDHGVSEEALDELRNILKAMADFYDAAGAHVEYRAVYDAERIIHERGLGWPKRTSGKSSAGSRH